MNGKLDFVSRSQYSGYYLGILGTVVVVGLVALPYVVAQGFTNTLVNLFILLILANMWNVLAGYGGLVSVGQQAFIGIGAYTVLLLAQHGIEPFLAIPVAVVVGAVFAYPISWFLFRLTGGYFAIATWVVAVAAGITITGIPSLGGGTGASLPGLQSMSSVLLGAFTYWASLAVVLASLVSVYLLLRSRLGLALTAVRDNEIGARSIGVKVTRAKRIVYLISAAGCAGAGALIAISQLNVQAANVFNVQWTAYMIFAVLIGGIGSIEGPIIGSVVFIVLQQSLARFNAWYLVIVGAVAVIIAIWARGGIWGVWADRSSTKLFPVGYFLRKSSPEGDQLVTQTNK
ncbi:MAG: branched-chain amino acid ABC transporter permease [Acidimicrobiaceae bacterium]|nr:branched-chain amino acid ABC transporter permease [Acidimicrobiaceae bacterium]